MGSWANSVHVRSDDAGAVVEAVREMLTDYGCRPSEEAPSGHELLVSASPLRAIRVSEPHNGWVSLLDSDLALGSELAMELADRLSTHALSVFVDDSDSWKYMLFASMDLVDEFDSMSEVDYDDLFDDELDEELLSGMDGAEVAQLQQQIAERAEGFQQRVQDAMPPEVREMAARWESGQAPTPEEMQRYGEWLNRDMPDLMAEMQEMIAQLTPLLTDQVEAAPRPRPVDDEEADAGDQDELTEEERAWIKMDQLDLAEHAEALGPLFADGVGSAQLEGALRAQSVFAEDDLRAFLPLIGIAPVYADLSYTYIEEFSPEDLAAAGVRIAAHLTFERRGEGNGGEGLRLI